MILIRPQEMNFSIYVYVCVCVCVCVFTLIFASKYMDSKMQGIP